MRRRPTRAAASSARSSGSTSPPGPLYLLGWDPPRRPGRMARFTFIFDMGTHDAEEVSARIRLKSDELAAAMVPPVAGGRRVASFPRRTVGRSAMRPGQCYLCGGIGMTGVLAVWRRKEKLRRGKNTSEGAQHVSVRRCEIP